MSARDGVYDDGRRFGMERGVRIRVQEGVEKGVREDATSGG
jgi:hypothetical protein